MKRFKFITGYLHILKESWRKNLPIKESIYKHKLLNGVNYSMQDIFKCQVPKNIKNNHINICIDLNELMK